MQMKVKITIMGEVHDVGYRLFLLNQADSLLITRFDARNVTIDGKQALIVLVEGEKELIEEFIKFVKQEKPRKAVVEEIKVEEFNGPIRTIDSYRDSLMLEQMNKIVQVGLDIRETQKDMLGMQKSMLEMQRDMLEKQDETIKAIREEGEKTRSHLGNKIDDLGSKIDDLRSDLRSYLDERLKKIEEEIEAIKAKIGMD